MDQAYKISNTHIQILRSMKFENKEANEIKKHQSDHAVSIKCGDARLESKGFRLSRTKTEYMMCDFSATRHEGGDVSLDVRFQLAG